MSPCALQSAFCILGGNRGHHTSFLESSGTLNNALGPDPAHGNRSRARFVRKPSLT